MDESVSRTAPASGGLPVSQSLHSLNSAEARIVEAIAARIFPTTDTPGATEAGAVFYIDRLLHKAYPSLLSTYQMGCAAADRHARKKFKQPFAALPPEKQDAVLRDFEQAKVPAYAKADRFFSLVRRHTMEGVLGEPSYGGNRNLVGWRLVGFPGQQFGYPDPYINRVVDLEPVAMDAAYPQEEALHGKR